MNNDVPNDTRRHISTPAAHTTARIDSVGKSMSMFDEVGRSSDSNSTIKVLLLFALSHRTIVKEKCG